MLVRSLTADRTQVRIPTRVINNIAVLAITSRRGIVLGLTARRENILKLGKGPCVHLRLDIRLLHVGNSFHRIKINNG